MIYLRQLRVVAIALGLVAAQGCKPETARKSDQAAENVIDKRARLDEQESNEADRSKRVDKQAEELTKASLQFQARKDVRIAALRAELGVISAQPTLIMSLAQTFPLTEAGRTAVAEKVNAFRAAVDDVGNRITDLDATDADEWKQRDDAMTDAMTKLDDARDEAWKALQNAPREAVRAS